MRESVVFGDRDEIEATIACGLRCQEQRTWDSLAAPTVARAVAVRGVHVEVAAIPARLCAELERTFAFGSTFALEANRRRVGRLRIAADVRNPEQQIPLP